MVEFAVILHLQSSELLVQSGVWLLFVLEVFYDLLSCVAAISL